MSLIPAASVLVTDQFDRILLVERGRDPQKGRWSLPGGKGEVGEDPGQTAIREAREETGLDLRLTQEVITTKMPGDGDDVYDIRCFAARIIGGDLKAGDDAETVRWVTRDELSVLPLTTGLDSSLQSAGYLPRIPEEAGAVRVADALQALEIPFSLRRYGRAGSLTQAAELRHIDAQSLLKSLVIRTRKDDYYLVLVPGDRTLHWPSLRKALGLTRVALPSTEEAERITGFKRGAITPFGLLTDMPVLMDANVPAGTLALGGGTPGWGTLADKKDVEQTVVTLVAPVSQSR